MGLCGKAHTVREFLQTSYTMIQLRLQGKHGDNEIAELALFVVEVREALAIYYRRSILGLKFT